jgi:hypothetical protein
MEILLLDYKNGFVSMNSFIACCKSCGRQEMKFLAALSVSRAEVGSDDSFTVL